MQISVKWHVENILQNKMYIYKHYTEYSWFIALYL